MKVLIFILLSFELVGQTMVLSNPYEDKIRSQLSTSLAAYDAAGDNTVIEITSAEFTNLQNNVSGTLGGASDTEWGAPEDKGNMNGAWVTSSIHTLPASNYIYAFRVKPQSSTDINGSGLYWSTAQTSGYSSIYSFPVYNSISYFAIKKPSTSDGSSRFIAYYTGGCCVGSTSYSARTGPTAYYGNPDPTSTFANYLPTNSYLYTSTIQW